ncbi:DNA polymerase III subunit gamma/tau C-terminal domain-containing protein, partial [Roseateles sp. GG27B]
PSAGHSARLRPRAAAPKPVAEDDVPPWLDAAPAEQDGGASASMRSGDASDGYEAEAAAEDFTSPDGGPHGANAAESRAYASTAGTDVALQPTALGERWAEQVQALGLTALTRELAMRAECVGVEEQGDTLLWRLRVERESLRQPALKDKLQAALIDALQRAVLIELEAGVAHDSPGLRAAAQVQARQRSIEQIVIKDPLAQVLLAQFKTARIVAGSIKSH